MGIFTTKINGERVSLATLRSRYLRLEAEYKDLHTAYARVEERDERSRERNEARRDTAYKISEATVKYRADIERLKKENEELREQLAEANAEIEARLKQVSDLSGQVAIARKVANDKRTEAEELRKWKPKRGKGGRFVKKN
jgi:predicted  nucleic acid-binding Zn-ribbon protein